ncbi:hypothetical protein N665_0304s0009 [Sinapis alba]|nr:hypothetical protein N665_0304s0009 [Sinapis alba]
MYPCTFVRIIVGNMAVRFPASSSSSMSMLEPSVSDADFNNWYYKIKFKSFPRQTVFVPVLFRTGSESDPRWCSGDVSTVAACFTLSKSQIEWSLGNFSGEETHGSVIAHHSSNSMHRNEREYIFTYVYECVYVLHLSILSSLTSGKEHTLTDRKGWSLTIHDLSGSPVAVASMVTPFLILRPHGYTMKPCGRLEAWREPGISDSLGYRFQLFQDEVATVISSSSSISTKLGGSFAIDGTITTAATVTAASLTLSDGSFDLSSGRRSSRTGSECGSDFGFLLPQAQHNFGFVIKPKVDVGMKHVRCLEDAATHVALAAAVDLSMIACRLFTHKVRKELRQPSSIGVV